MNTFSQIKDRSAYVQALEDDEMETTNVLDISDVRDERVNKDPLHEYIEKDIDLLMRYSLDQGKKLPAEVGNLVSTGSFEDAFMAHKLICEALQPATPETIKYILKYQKKNTLFFSNIPLVRNFILVAILAIGGLIGSGLSPKVNATALSKGILNNEGIPLLINLIFLCSAAAIGSVFFILSRLTKEVKNATLNSDDTTYYWTMLIMGVLSGLIMCEIIILSQAVDNQSVEVNRLLFALLGGFSSEVVFTILQKIMQKVRDIINGL